MTMKNSFYARTANVFLKFGGVTVQESALTTLMKKAAPLQPHLLPVRMTSSVAAMGSVFQIPGNVICIPTVLMGMTKLDVPRVLRVPRRNSSAISLENAFRRIPGATASQIVQTARMKLDAVS